MIVAYFLVTTADEHTWKFDRPVLFLGEWCRRYNRKHIWKDMHAVVAPPYGLQVGQKERDLAYIESVASQLLHELADALNAYHTTSHAVRYWNIVIGHWLRRYLMVIFNRYFTLEQALKNHEVSASAVLDCKYSLATNDSMTFILACNDDMWNHVLYGRILKALGHIEIEPTSVSLSTSGFMQYGALPVARKQSVKRRILNAAKHVLSKCSRKCDAFIVRSYLPFLQEVALQLSLGQCPQLWESPPLENVARDAASPRHFSVPAENYTGFEWFVRRQLGDIIPTCYLEGYEQIVQRVKSLPWPARPRFIFTSNTFDTDEIFKVWCGGKVEEGIPYFTGQHGNNYGTSVYAGNPHWPERAAADRFFTWGWSDGSPNVVPVFHFKAGNLNSHRANAAGGLLLIELSVQHYMTPWDGYFEFGLYQEEQFRFIDALPEAIQRKLTVRLHRDYKHHRWCDEQRWKDRCPHTRIETGLAELGELIDQSRLVVHSYDGTGFLETLSANIPTLCFWHSGTEQLLPSARPYYALLRSAGILVDTPEEAAELIALHWDNVDKWWGTPKVQDARRLFCEQYARREKHPVATLKRLLTTHASMVRP